MALNYTADNQKVDCGSAAVLDNLDPFTAMMWLYPTSSATLAHLYSKAPAGGGGVLVLRRNSSPANDLLFVRTRATTTTFYETNDAPLTTSNKWYFVAVSFASASTPVVHIYVGDLSTLAVESTYGTSIDGSGALETDAANNLRIGSSGTSNINWRGRIALYHLVGSELSLGQIKEQQFRPHVVANSKLFMHLGYNGTGTQPDWSGNFNSGAVTGATVAPHVSLGPSFGFDSDWQGAFTAAVGGLSIPVAMNSYRQRYQSVV